MAFGFWDGIGFEAIGVLEKAPLPMRIAPIPKAKSPRMVPIVAGENVLRATRVTDRMLEMFKAKPKTADQNSGKGAGK